MTVLSSLTVPASPQTDAGMRPLPWGRMVWVTWRQQRVALTGAVTLLGAVAVYLWIAGVHLHDAYAAATACHPANSIACTQLTSAFNGEQDWLANGMILHAIPALIGAFVGAPVLARELETGTFRYAWTQGFGRSRWTVSKLVGLAIVLAAAAGALSLLISWYFQPYFATSNQALSLNETSPLAPSLFDLRGVAFAGWTLAAFAIGGLAGVLIRRVVPAIVVTLGAYAGLVVATGAYLRAHYLTPLVTTSLNLSGSAWVLSQQWLTRSGSPASAAALSGVLNEEPQLAGKGGVPRSLGVWQYLVHHGYTLSTVFQPASRFWPFQWIEGGSLLALSVLLIGLTVWVVHRRA